MCAHAFIPIVLVLAYIPSMFYCLFKHPHPHPHPHPIHTQLRCISLNTMSFILRRSEKKRFLNFDLHGTESFLLSESVLSSNVKLSNAKFNQTSIWVLNTRWEIIRKKLFNLAHLLRKQLYIGIVNSLICSY